MLKLYNTLTRKKEVFKPARGKKINLFVCGPTVYDFSHLGHAKTYLFFDFFSKYLKERGYKVFYLQNITDIDDKIIKKAEEQNVSAQKLARDFEKEYFKDMKTLKINNVTKYARATEHIKEIISQVKRLLKKDFAYQTDDGIYYDISKFKEYGKLSGRTLLQAQDAVSRIDESVAKKNKGDFCLWKFSKPNEPKWKSPWGQGRPGWHIEDTAITEKFFGPQYDIHGGGRDLIFPHHEAEIAQMEAISGKEPLVKFWIHVGFLTVNNEKMSKSLANFITIRDFLEKHSPRILRFFFLKNLYRSPVDYNENAILQAKKELERIDEFTNKLKGKSEKRKAIDKKVSGLVSKTQKELEAALDDDFNTPQAMAVLFGFVNQGNRLLNEGLISKSNAREIIKFLEKIDRYFNFIFWKAKKQIIPLEIKKLVQEREKCRKTQNWEKADELRKQIEKSGYKIEDTEKGPIIKSSK